MPGLIQPKILDPRDWLFGGATGIVEAKLVPGGNWLTWLPDFEKQYNSYFDSYACVTFSLLNAIETLLYKKYNIRVNFSDRYVARAAGTKCNIGNSYARVCETIRTMGAPLEADYPFGGDVKSCEEYYKDLTDDLYQRARGFLDAYTFKYEYVYWTDPQHIKDALEYAPLAIAVDGRSNRPTKDGIIQGVDVDHNHSELLYGYVDGEYWMTLNHYQGTTFKKYSWDYPFGAKLKVSISLKDNTMPIPSIPNNTLIQLVEGQGGFALVLDGKKIVDDLDKVMATWIVRNSGKIEGKVQAVSLAKWDALPSINLKKEPV